MIGTLLTFFAVGLATIILAVVVLAVLGTLLSIGLGLASFLLFKVGPILLIGWVVVKLLDRRKRKSYLSESDRRWLEGD